MQMKLIHKVGWMPVREEKGLDSVYTLTREANFTVRPVAGEELMIGGELFKVANFYHDLDASALVVCLVREWAFSPEEAESRKEKLIAGGWHGC